MHIRLTSLRASRGVRWTFGLGKSLLLTFSILFGCFAPVFALGTGRLTVNGVDTHAFPRISFTLEVHDASGAAGDLKPADLRLDEDGSQPAVTDVKLQPRGLQFSIALNAGPELSAKSGTTSQLDGIKQALQVWLGAETSAGENSLATNSGMPVIRAKAVQQLADGLNTFQPDPAKNMPSLASLTAALDLAVDASANGALKPAVLFITPPMNDSALNGLETQTKRAAQMNASVFVWVVVQDDKTPAAGQDKLQALADQTGGKLALVTLGGSFPDLGEWLNPLRQIYLVSYQSSLRKGGEHQLSVQLTRGGQTLSSDAPVRFKLDVKPPNPMFINPPEKVARGWSEGTQSQPSALTPATLDMQMLVEFPDGFERPLHASRLYANGKLVAENTAPPFDHFNWKLDDVTQSGTILVKAEVEDGLGLTASTIELPMEFEVAAQPSRSFLPHFSSQGLIAVGAVLLTGTILGLVVLGENRLRGRGRRSTRDRSKDPVTQPVQVSADRPRPRKNIAPAAWSRVTAQPGAPAKLVRLNENEQAINGNTVPLGRAEVTFGSDPHLAGIALEDPSVQPVHARLTRTRENGFLLYDEGSVAGTWVNFAQINGVGKRLEHGDLIHMGRVMFRFELAQPPAPREPEISLVEDNP